MNMTYVHLVLNHGPVVGTIGCVLLLTGALFARSRPVAIAGLVGLVLVALVTIPVFYTGEPAEEDVEHRPGFNEAAIHDHEEAGEVAFVVSEIAGGVALIALIMLRVKGNVNFGWIAAITLVALVSAFVMGRAALLGGKIRHTELETAAPMRE